MVCLELFTAGSLMAAPSPLTTLHVFNETDGNDPAGAWVLGTNGNFYGVTSYGGTGTNFCISGCGTVFEITSGGAFTSLHSFTNSDGEAPRGGLAQGSDGNLYGTTASGGFFGLGTVFRITPSGVLTTIHSFSLKAAPRPRAPPGQGSFSYTGGTNRGVDTIRAVSLGATGTSTSVWIERDSVGDGIPDWWRAQYFGGNGTTTNGQSCATCDADGTGQNNLFKYVAGLIQRILRRCSCWASRT